MVENKIPEYILAIHEDSNANATLFKKGKIYYSVQEERLSRIKYDAGFPHRSIDLILKLAGISIEDVDLVIAANKYHFLPRMLHLFGYKLPVFEHNFIGLAQKVYLYFHHLLLKSPKLRWSIERFNNYALRKIFKKPVLLVDHHTAHAYSAYITSGFDKAIAITTDNFGDGYAVQVYSCENGRCRFLRGCSALESPGQFYGEISQVLGFHPLQAGKMTGLAAFGKPDILYNKMIPLFDLNQNKTKYLLPPMYKKRIGRGIYKELKDYPPADVAAAAQKRLEDVCLEFVKNILKGTYNNKIVLAGGVFGNVRLNQLIMELPEVDEVFVHPGMSDCGLSIGAGLYYLATRFDLKPFKLQDVYFGPEYSEKEIEKACISSQLKFEKLANIEEKVADLLVNGKVVALFNGRMEYGPRALGNRSILYKTTDPSVNDWLNKNLHRSEFMPFAPVTLAEFADKCYINLKKGEYTAKFMTISFHCTQYMKETSPGVVHIDGTARPQILDEQTNPRYYKILWEYYKKTGIPSLINTSFNMHEEPIVCSPQDAIRAFINGNLDYLAMGNFLVHKVSKS